MPQVVKKNSSRQIGLNVGIAGRWVRLLGGTWLTGAMVLQVIHSNALNAGIEMAIYFIAVLAVYILSYYFFSNRILSELNAWARTVILLAPVFAVFSFQIGPDELRQGILLYIGISLIVSFFMGYGGCEVVSIPSLIFRVRHTIYCPLNAVDAVEKAVINRKSKPS